MWPAGQAARQCQSRQQQFRRPGHQGVMIQPRRKGQERKDNREGEHQVENPTGEKAGMPKPRCEKRQKENLLFGEGQDTVNSD